MRWFKTSRKNEWLQITIGNSENPKAKKKKRQRKTNRIQSTKYTLITFLPQNLLEQFRRLSNFYFLVIAIVSLLVDSPVSPITSLLPLVIVIGVTATKQGYEDILRHRTDNVVNCSPVTVIRDGKETDIECQHIGPGDLVVVRRDCDVPCDVVILKSSDAHDKCFVTTANLDGETNLKTLIIPRGLPKVEINQMHQLGIIECESPKTDLYSFNGKIELFHSSLLDDSQPKVLPLSADNILLRGSRIKNTECVIGCAVYTGMTSKLALNSKLTRNKYASSEAYINWFLVFIMGAMLCICAYMSLMKWSAEANSAPEATYLGPTSSYTPGLFFQDYLSFVILFNYLIPISLYVTIELHRVFGGFFLEWDIEVYDKETDEHLIVNTSDLNEDLGQINILFSDKTGTLTKNEMIFQRCSINGKKLVHKKTKLLDEDTDTLLDFNTFDNNQKNFFQGLAICHTVQVAKRICETDPKTGTRIQADSNLNVHEIFSQGNTMNKSSTVKKTRPKTIFFSEQGTEVPMKRLNSETDLSKNVKPATIKTHRKSKSYGTSPVYIAHTVNINSHRRTPSNVSRESYAIPNFIPRHPSMRLKFESMRRKKVLQAVVETLDYQASSPDEKALVEACADLGVVYLGDDNGIMNVRICPPHMDYSKPFSSAKVNEVPFERLHVLEFTSDRKRMSIMVKDELGSIWIYTKGAENYVFSLCSPSSERLIEVTNTHINDFAVHGLRTLAVARRRITDEEYNNFLSELNRANVSLENRKQLTEECYAKIEQNLDLLGATAVQDALQDDVAKTLFSLKKAGIKVWVLTGDKIETALNIALSCGHIPANAMRYFIAECNHKEDLNVHLDMLDQEIILGYRRPCALLIDGKSLAIALKELPQKFREISIRCQAVLCCRLSPLQKSEVVSLIKTCKEKYITAAIGDGANDVSMIQEAHIGIGIMGKEGRQAARCADFAFARFNMLTRLFLVHGQYFTIRLSMLVLYFFYKNILFMGIMFLFQYVCMFSAQSVYDSWFLTFYNTLYSSLPVLFLSVTEKPFTEAELMRKPELYAQNTHNKQLRWNYFLHWVLFGVFHTVIIFFFTFYLFSINDVVLNVGQTAELSVFGMQVMQAVVIVVNLKLWLESRYHSYWYIATIWGSIICFMVTTVNYNIVDMTFNTEIYWAYNKLFCSIPLWLLTMVCSIACLIPDYVILCCKKALNMPKRNFYSKIQRLIRL